LKSTLTVFFILLTSATYAQKDTNVTVNQGVTVLVAAHFPGGPNEWQKYLQKNLQVDIAGMVIRLRPRQQDSVQTVLVSFLVDKTGSITEAKVENEEEVNPRLAAEALRVIQEGPRWIPATKMAKLEFTGKDKASAFKLQKGKWQCCHFYKYLSGLNF